MGSGLGEIDAWEFLVTLAGQGRIQKDRVNL